MTKFGALTIPAPLMVETVLFGFLVSKEAVVLCRWESETKIWFYPTS